MAHSTEQVEMSVVLDSSSEMGRFFLDSDRQAGGSGRLYPTLASTVSRSRCTDVLLLSCNGEQSMATGQSCPSQRKPSELSHAERQYS